jgi:translation elongation factor P/translation initiation factor 5A
MSIPAENQPQEQKNDSIETNLAKQRQMYERRLEQERMARQQAEEKAAAAERVIEERSKQLPSNEDEDDNEPYVDKKNLQKTLAKFGEKTKQQTQQEIQHAVQAALDNERRSQYLKENGDFNQTMNPEMVEKFAAKYPRLAENILRMPDGFERQKLVYENIKALGLDQPEQKPPSIQEKIEANRRTPYYQPSGVATSPYAGQGDFSQAGQKSAFEKMQELKSRLRL